MTIKEKMLRIMELALEINDPEVDDIGKQKTAVFVEWAPHCNVLQVNIHTNGWKSNTYPDIQYRCYTDNEKASNSLNEVILALEELKERESDV